jgi:hypothetical protein
MKPLNLDAFITCAEELLRHDEVERALQLLDLLPGLYRYNVPLKIVEFKNEILKQITTPTYYAKHDSPLVLPEDHKAFANTLRGSLLLKDVQEFNKQGDHPFVFDLGPGTYDALLMLKAFGCIFLYDCLFLHESGSSQEIKALYSDLKPEAEASAYTTIFVANELIEHLPNPHDIKADMLRTVGLADIIHISTPTFCFHTKDDWRENRNLEHLRTYTPHEFIDTVSKIFPEYKLEYHAGQIQHLRLLKHT